MKAYTLRPTMHVFDGSGTLTPSADQALTVIAAMVVQCLRQGGDTSHRAAISEGAMIDIDMPPTIFCVAGKSDLTALIRRLLDPNTLAGGDIRSTANCRTVTFGQDGQAFLCLRHEDSAPSSPEPTLVTVAEESMRLSETDLFDGSWPAAG
jgi:hypothetical protein